MEKIYLIFDYFKKAFHINQANKKIYRPQIALIIVKTLILIVCGLTIYSYIGNNRFSDYNANNWFGFIIYSVLVIALLLIILGIISVLVESGLYNMYKMCVINNEIKPGDFKEGIRKYFFKFLLGDILIALAWIIIFIPYIIVGTITLTIGLAVIPIAINILLTMWKVSIVINDNDLIKAFKDSFSFAKKNFIPLTVLQMIHWAFVKGTYSSSTGTSYVSNAGNYYSSFNNKTFGTDYNLNPPSIETVVKTAKIVCAILIPIVSIANIVALIMNMIFEVFFTLVIFITYIEKFEKAEKKNTMEVESHVV
ncbi:MAG TPA: hypothetical protein VIK72_08065 [Clostridiaceae bacterium]